MTAGRADVALEAVVVAVTDGRPRVLTVGSATLPRLPSGPPAAGVTLERGLRRLLEEQTGLAVGYVEQLYTFGDRGLEPDGARKVGVAYLGLTRETRTSASWIDVYQLFPWEDRRGTT
ncbi:MAG: hypothetical protein R3246_13940, partial [Acidimicrobiia bacterium]|nr:hypothetical protein [Acidimicrobiia bacterium]